MNLTHVLQSHVRKTGVRDLKMHCICGWSAEGLDATLFLQHQSDVISDVVTGWIELFCQQVSVSFGSYADMLEDGTQPVPDIIDALRQNAANYLERADEVREDGTF